MPRPPSRSARVCDLCFTAPPAARPAARAGPAHRRQHVGRLRHLADQVEDRSGIDALPQPRAAHAAGQVTALGVQTAALFQHARGEVHQRHFRPRLQMRGQRPAACARLRQPWSACRTVRRQQAGDRPCLVFPGRQLKRLPVGKFVVELRNVWKTCGFRCVLAGLGDACEETFRCRNSPSCPVIAMR